MKEILLAIGTETGMSEMLAEETLEVLEGIADVTICDINDIKDFASLSESTMVLIITSTMTDGRAPNSAAVFHDSIELGKLKPFLFYILAMGDSAYKATNEYCVFGLALHDALSSSGAIALAPCVTMDTINDDAAYKQWLNVVVHYLEELNG